MEKGPSTPFSDSSTLNGGASDDAVKNADMSVNTRGRVGGDGDAPSDEEEIKRRIRAADSKKERIYETARWLRQYRNIEVGEDGDIYAYDGAAGVWRGRYDNDDGMQTLRERLYDTLRQDYDSNSLRSVIEHLKAQGRTEIDTFGTPSKTVAVKNGLLELHSGNLVKLQPEHRALWQMPVRYDPSADCPKFKAALKQWVPNKPTRKTLQEYVGSALDDSSVKFQKMLFLLGPTDTGKSVFLEVIERLFGEEHTASQSIQYLANQRWGVDKIIGKPINVRHDLDTNVIKRTGMVKELASGNPMNAEAKHGDPYKARPTAKHFFSANQVPQRNSPDKAFYNRWLTVRFHQQIPEDDQNEDMEDELTTPDELSGILNWAVKGYQRLHEQGGFTKTRSPEETRELWRTYGDSIDQFIVDWILKNPDSEVKKSKVYDEYVTYAKAQGEPVENQQQVTSRLNRLDWVSEGQVRGSDSNPRVFRGIELIGDMESDDE
jgi:putative DNA primase/helicase